MTIGEWIKRQRTHLGFTQTSLATLLEVNRSAIAQWESGVTKPHVLRKDRIGFVLGDLRTSIPEKIVKATWG